MALDLLGGLYLAYDLLGGRTGPLRTMMRVASYSVLYFSVYSLLVGELLGLIFGIGLGVILGIEFSTMGRLNKAVTPTRLELALLVGRGVVFGVATGHLFGLAYGAVFGGSGTLFLLAFYYMGYAPRHLYDVHQRPRLTRTRVVGAIVRAVVVLMAGVVASLVTGIHSALNPGVQLGLLVGVGNAIISLLSPYVEWYTDNVPERYFGLFGVLLIFLGALLQSVQYWAGLLDIQVL